MIIGMPTKLKSVSGQGSARRAVATLSARPVVPRKDRRLTFGNQWDFAPAPEDAKNYSIAPRHELFINGKFVAPHSGKYFASINPATEEKLTEIAAADEVDVDNAVKAARRAYDNVWSKMPGRERGKYLYRIARIIQEKSRELAVLETMDGGKPIKESRDVDLPLVAAHFFYYAGWADKLKYAFPGQNAAAARRRGADHSVEFSAAHGRVENRARARVRQHRRAQARRDHQPHGAAAGADFSGGGIARRRGEHRHRRGRDRRGARQSSGHRQDCVHRQHGGREGDCESNCRLGARAPFGRRRQPRPTEDTPRLTLELGGKAANILFEDAPIDQAIEGVINGIYFNQGHVCCAGSRLFVQEGIYSKVIKKLRDRIQTLRVGNPLDKNTDIGAINSRPQLEKIRELVQSGVDEGAELTQTQCTLPAKGYWFAPSFLTGVTHAHRVASEEIFGPVLSVMTFRTPEEAFERANNIPYGLSAGVWTDKGSKIFKMVNKLRAGVVWANTYNKFDPTSPFGGYKESGFGREGGLQGLAAYCRLD